MRKVLIALSLLAFVPSVALAGSHCGNNTECKQSDKELNQVWQSLSKTEQNAIKPLQQKWIENRNRTCGTDWDCVAKETRRRTVLLREMTSCTNNPNKIGCNGN